MSELHDDVNNMFALTIGMRAVTRVDRQADFFSFGRF
jgi:hypothetical protein